MDCIYIYMVDGEPLEAFKTEEEAKAHLVRDYVITMKDAIAEGEAISASDLIKGVMKGFDFGGIDEFGYIAAVHMN